MLGLFAYGDFRFHAGESSGKLTGSIFDSFFEQVAGSAEFLLCPLALVGFGGESVDRTIQTQLFVSIGRAKKHEDNTHQKCAPDTVNLRGLTDKLQRMSGVDKPIQDPQESEYAADDRRSGPTHDGAE